MNGDGNLVIEDMNVPGGQTLVDLIFEGPKDTASVIYGNGYDRCGDLTYLWLDSQGKEFTNMVFSANATVVN